MPSTTKHVAMLDLLRGVAAVAVVLFHLPDQIGTDLVPHGYLAVDFFFMLSGFVMASAYQAKLDDGWGTFAFMRTRLIRLYPLYLVGLSLGMISLLQKTHLGLVSTSYSDATLSYIRGLVFTPTRGGDAFPANSALWSLMYEVLANLLHALFMRRRSLSTIGIVTMVASVLLGRIALYFNTLDKGPLTQDFLFGLVRLVVAYLIGILIQRIVGPGSGKLTAIWSAFAAALLFLPMCSHVHSGLTDFLVVVGLFPSVLVFSTHISLTGWNKSLASLAGQLSYPCYALHLPLLGAIRRMLAHQSTANVVPPLELGLVTFILLIFISYGADKVDQRVRKWLTSMANSKQVPHQIASA